MVLKVDGYLKIKTKIDNKDVDKGIIELENKIKKLQEDNSKASEEQSSLQREIDSYEQLQQKADAYRHKIKELQAEKDMIFKSNPALAFQGNMQEYENIKVKIGEIQQKYAQAVNEIDKQSPKIEKVRTKLDKVKSKQTENNTKIEQFKQKIEQINLKKVQSGIDNVGQKIQGTVSKLGKMTMAVFGIRTAFNAVRQAMNIVAQYNPQISADLEYMRYCIANLLAPAVQWLTKLLYTALSYVNAIASAWFGINLFSNSSAKNFQKMQKSASGTAKAMKEINKSRESFDEMNVLQDDGSVSGNTGTGISAPNTDLSNIQGEVPSWLKWITDNKDLILSILAGIASGILAIKLGLGGIKALGIGVLITGIIYTVQSLLAYLKDPSWKNFGKIIQSIGVAVIGLGILIGNVPLIVIGAIVLIVGTIIKYWKQIKNFLQSGIDWLASKSDWVHEMFGDTVGDIYDSFVECLQGILDAFDGLFTGVKEILDGIISIFKGIFTGDMQLVLEGFKQIFKGVFDALYGIAKYPLSLIGISADELFNGLKTAIKGVYNVFKGIFTGDMKLVLEGFKQIFKGVFDALWSIAKAPLNLIIKGINSLIKGANKIHFDIPDWVPGFGGKTFGFNIQQIPLLAKGGVISQPTTAIIGEAGKEAVMPLENNLEWLDILATKIANKIDIGEGAYIINMDSRTIQRGIVKRQQELAFAKNGR